MQIIRVQPFVSPLSRSQLTGRPICVFPNSRYQPAPAVVTGARSVFLMQALLFLVVACATNGPKVKSYLHNIDSYPDHNAFITVVREPAPALDGPLNGMLIVVSDNIHVAGLPSTAGTSLLREFVPAADAEAVARLKGAGARIIGKGNMHEFAYGVTSVNPTFGTVRNAINPAYMAGGSCGGIAVAVALGMADAGLGMDTNGSVRIPAALNGLVGFRPTNGRYPNDGMMSISTTKDTIGSIAKTVTDVILLDKALVAGEGESAKPVETLKGLRLGVPLEYFYELLDPDVLLVMHAVLGRLQDNGVVLVRENLSGVQQLNANIGVPIMFYETKSLLPKYLAGIFPNISTPDLVAGIASPDVRILIQGALAGTFTRKIYLDVRDRLRQSLRRSYADYFARNDVEAIIFPTTPLPARELAEDMSTVVLGSVQVPVLPAYISNTDPGSNAAIPGISLPAGTSSSGLPIGIELDGPSGSDSRLLLIAKAIEELLMQAPDGDGDAQE